MTYPGPDRGSQPLPPPEFGVALDPAVRRPRPHVLVGGHPVRVLRLRPAGGEQVDAWAQGAPIGPSRAAGSLARRLFDAGIAHPCPPTGAGLAGLGGHGGDPGAGPGRGAGPHPGGARGGGGRDRRRRRLAPSDPWRRHERHPPPSDAGPGGGPKHRLAGRRHPPCRLRRRRLRTGIGLAGGVAPPLRRCRGGGGGPPDRDRRRRRERQPPWPPTSDAGRRSIWAAGRPRCGPAARCRTCRPPRSWCGASRSSTRAASTRGCAMARTWTWCGGSTDWAGGSVTSRPPPWPIRLAVVWPWLDQRYHYGRSAAPLAARHGPAVAPVAISPWTAAAWGLAASWPSGGRGPGRGGHLGRPGPPGRTRPGHGPNPGRAGADRQPSGRRRPRRRSAPGLAASGPGLAALSARLGPRTPALALGAALPSRPWRRGFGNDRTGWAR